MAWDVRLQVDVLMMFAAPTERNSVVCRSMVMMIVERVKAIFLKVSGKLVLMVLLGGSNDGETGCLRR